MRPRDVQNATEGEDSEAAGDEAARHEGDGHDHPEGGPRTPEIPDISIFESRDDDGEWYDDGDPTQEVDDNDIVDERSFVLVGDGGEAIPRGDDASSRAAALFPEPEPGEGAAASRKARLPAPVADGPLSEVDAAAPAAIRQEKGAGMKKAGTGQVEKREAGAPPDTGKRREASEARADRSEGENPSASEDNPAPTPVSARAHDTRSPLELATALREEGEPLRAIEALTRALTGGARGVDCHTVMGLCYMDQGIAAKAISSYKNALFYEGVTELETIALHYELGRAQEWQEEWQEALYHYRRVIKVDPEHRDTAVRIAEIKQLVAKQQT